MDVERRIARLVLNRPERHNAFDDEVIAELTWSLTRLAEDPGVRLIVLAGEGRSFCAGADMAWMKRAAGYTHEENLADAKALAELMRAIHNVPKPTIARVQGDAYGGGVGLVAACDIAVAAEGARFALSEVRLGLIPAVISPYLLKAIGARAARRYMLTGERFDAREAGRLGLVHAVAPAAELDSTVQNLVNGLLEGGPGAQADVKRLIWEVAGRKIDSELVKDTARRIADTRASPEGREGIAAFLEKRQPVWRAG